MEIKWAKCALIKGMNCWVQVFSLLLDSSVGLSVGIQSAGELVSETSQFWILHSAEEDNLLSGVPDYFGRNKISSGGDLSHYSRASLY